MMGLTGSGSSAAEFKDCTLSTHHVLPVAQVGPAAGVARAVALVGRRGALPRRKRVLPVDGAGDLSDIMVI
jgi:hypothetical protein